MPKNIIIHNDTEQTNILAEKLPDGKVWSYAKYNDSATLRQLLSAFGLSYKITEEFFQYLADVTQLPNVIPVEFVMYSNGLFAPQAVTFSTYLNEERNDVFILWGDGNTGKVDNLSPLQAYTNVYSIAETGDYKITIQNPKYIESFYIPANNFGLNIPNIATEIAKFEDLKYLQIENDNSPMGGDFTDFMMPKNLETLYFKGNDYTGDIGTFVFSDTLQSFELYDETISGDIEGVSFNTSLETIVINSTTIAGDLSAATLPTGLKNLTLVATSMADDITSMTWPSSLEYLYLFSNPFTGTVTSWTWPSTLRQINIINESNLTGSLASWTLPTSLIELQINNTSLTGDISGWTLPTSMFRLETQNNSLSGDISSWSLPTTLGVLYIDRNSFSGDISNWTFPSELNEIIMSDNNLSYGVGGFFAGLSSSEVQYIYFDNNGLISTEVDQVLVDLDNSGIEADTCFVYLAGTNSSPTATGLAAISSLEDKNFIIDYN